MSFGTDYRENPLARTKIIATVGPACETREALRDWEGSQFSHGLHRDKDQQYYEMIGKYHQFSWGWDDFRENNAISMSDYEITQRYNEDKSTINKNRLKKETRR